jgi:NitT/TauT family transport system substrate-binding protein
VNDSEQLKKATTSMRKLLTIGALGILAGAAAMISTTIPAAAQKKLEPYTVRSGAPVPNAANTYAYVATKMGYFAEEGLAVEIRQSQNTSQATQLAASGESDAGYFSFEAFVAGYEKGMRGKFYLPTNRHNLFWITTLEGGDIKTAEQLRGKKIGVTNMGSGSLVIARSILRLANIQPDNSMFVPVGAGPSARQALESGRVDALSLWDANYSSLIRSGAKLHNIMHPKLATVPSVGVFISDASVKARRKAHVGYLRAIIKARAYMARYREEALKMYWDAVPGARTTAGKTPEEQLKNGLAELGFMDAFAPGTPDSQLAPAFNFDELEHFLAALKADGVFTAGLKATDLYSNELLAEIGPIDFSKITKEPPSDAK